MALPPQLKDGSYWNYKCDMYLIDGAALLVVEAAVREHQLEVGQNLILRPAARFLNLLEDKFKTSWRKYA